MMNLIEENKKLIKIDETGQYCSFPGVTVVSAIGSENIDLWSRLFEAFNQSTLLKEFYGLLPMNSYHMTTLNLFVKARVEKEAWKDFIERQLPWFQSLHEEIEKASFRPQVLSVTPHFYGSIILLQLHIPKEQSQFNEELARKFSLTGSLPEFFHITIGYQYKAFDQTIALSLTNEFEKIAQSVLGENTKPVTLDPPHLTYFNDMTAFIPWDGKENPF